MTGETITFHNDEELELAAWADSFLSERGEGARSADGKRSNVLYLS